MLQVADAIIAAEPMLSQADRDLGDGDHGLGMKRGMEAVKDQLESMDPSSVEQVFVTVGTAMMTRRAKPPSSSRACFSGPNFRSHGSPQGAGFRQGSGRVMRKVSATANG